MNRSIFIGLACAGILFHFGLFGEVKAGFFLNVHALVVVLVGTLTAGFFSAPPGRFISIFAGAAKMLFVGKPTDAKYIKEIIEDVFAAAQASKNDRDALSKAQCRHPFLKEGMGLVADGILNEDEIFEVLSRRKELFQRNYLSDAHTLHSLAKFPPAFGLLGAVTGMIAMMSKLATESDKIGDSMAIALVATFWGICTANVLLLPLSDYYNSLAEDDAFIRQIIIDAVIMLKRREPSALIEEKLNSYLSPKERRSSGGGGSARRAA